MQLSRSNVQCRFKYLRLPPASPPPLKRLTYQISTHWGSTHLPAVSTLFTLKRQTAQPCLVCSHPWESFEKQFIQFQKGNVLVFIHVNLNATSLNWRPQYNLYNEGREPTSTAYSYRLQIWPEHTRAKAKFLIFQQHQATKVNSWSQYTTSKSCYHPAIPRTGFKKNWPGINKMIIYFISFLLCVLGWAWLYFYLKLTAQTQLKKSLVYEAFWGRR